MRNNPLDTALLNLVSRVKESIPLTMDTEYFRVTSVSKMRRAPPVALLTATVAGPWRWMDTAVCRAVWNDAVLACADVAPDNV